MTKGRLEAFSDGVFAVVITIMVLEIKTPHGPDLHALAPLAPVFLAYVLSFLYIGIYWNNHHHLLHSIKRVTGGILWANLHLLFWLSLLPVVTGWAGENHTMPWPAALYGIVLLMSGVAWLILQTLLLRREGPDSPLARAVGADLKGKASAVLYTIGIAVAFVQPIVSQLLYAVVALMWIVPDRRIERELTS